MTYRAVCLEAKMTKIKRDIMLFQRVNLFILCAAYHELLNKLSTKLDQVAPQISAITEPVLTGNNARIGWTTNEVATALIEFGTQAGVYTGSITAPAGTGPQQFALPGLAWGTTYFLRIRVNDSHGNVTTSAEFSFTTPRAVFLPLIRR